MGRHGTRATAAGYPIDRVPVGLDTSSPDITPDLPVDLATIPSGPDTEMTPTGNSMRSNTRRGF